MTSIRKIIVATIALFVFAFSGTSALAQEPSTTCPTGNELLAWTQGATGTVKDALGLVSNDLNKINLKLAPEQQLAAEGIAELSGELVCSAIVSMRIAQQDVWQSFEDLEDRVFSLPDDDPRRQVVGEILGDTGRFGAEVRDAFQDVFAPFRPGADKADVADIDRLLNLLAEDHLEIVFSIGGALPTVGPDDTFELAEQGARAVLSRANQALLTPLRPGNVPDCDLIECFIPQVIRLLYRFAWLMVFISFVVSGAIFVIGASKEEWLEKAKRIAYFSVIGFALVAFSFAIVKAVTNIDFFGFI